MKDRRRIEGKMRDLWESELWMIGTKPRCVIYASPLVNEPSQDIP